MFHRLEGHYLQIRLFHVLVLGLYDETHCRIALRVVETEGLELPISPLAITIWQLSVNFEVENIIAGCVWKRPKHPHRMPEFRSLRSLVPTRHNRRILSYGHDSSFNFLKILWHAFHCTFVVISVFHFNNRKHSTSDLVLNRLSEVLSRFTEPQWEPRKCSQSCRHLINVRGSSEINIIITIPQLSLQLHCKFALWSNSALQS